MSIYDVTTPIATLESFSLGGGFSVFNDLDSGTLYGTQTASAADNGQFINFTLGAAGISALNSNIGRQMAFGATVNPGFVAAPIAVPEPSSLAIFGTGFLALAGFGALRRRKVQQAA